MSMCMVCGKTEYWAEKPYCSTACASAPHPHESAAWEDVSPDWQLLALWFLAGAVDLLGWAGILFLGYCGLWALGF